MAVHVLALTIELHLPASQSLKEKRSIVKSIIESTRRRFQVATAELDHLDTWQRAQLGFVVISGSVRHCEEVIDEVERFVWNAADTEVIESRRHWMEVDG